MKVLIVSQPEVGRLLPMPECIAAMAEALAALARGEAVLPLRQVVRLSRARRTEDRNPWQWVELPS